MKLYYSPGACSLAPHIVAREAGIPLDLEKVDLGAHKLADGSNYYDVNPRGYVPAIRVKADEPVLTEANVVVQFLAYAGFNAKAHRDGTSFVHLGEAQFDASVSIWDDATDPRTLGPGGRDVGGTDAAGESDAGGSGPETRRNEADRALSS